MIDAHKSDPGKLDAVLACPACHGEIAIDDQGSWVVCAGCERRYPVVDGIPVLIAARAQVKSL